MTVSTSKKAALALLAAGTAIALAGCSGGAEPTHQNGAPVDNEIGAGLFQFKTQALQAEGELVIELPEDLLDALSENSAERVTVKRIVITPADLDSSSSCGIDMKFEYVDGAAEAQEAAEVEKTETENQAIRESYEERDEPVNESMLHDYAGTLGPWSSHYGVAPIAELDPQETGVYYSTDRTEATAVLPCSASPFDDDDALLLNLGIADVEVTVMKSGTLGIAASDVYGYVLDSQGNWIDG